MNIILIGAQGSGKGTQAERLAHSLGMHHVSSGDLFRKESEAGTEFGKQAQAYFDRGELVPDDLTVAMVLKHISADKYVRDGVLLDGFPRTIAQAQALDQGLSRVGRSIDCSIYLDVPREELLHRLSGRYICRAHQHVYNIETNPPKVPGVCDLDGSELYQRADDKGEAIHKRLDTFYHETMQLLDYYKKQHKLKTVNGNQSIEQVSQSLIDAVKGCHK
ncbi:adenylate kinase [Dictyobacter kobayashii]|uniref:Adenylate kinase n=1 Tax=Dictyobacter kobayashii TaxID=2014872 RepID=A0A402AH03_9CHLR|nr:adenylate kinase [Dictyobacter kobayashii]GCE18392.1 adenylate kinase [Dictyobacter kobayashii]